MGAQPLLVQDDRLTALTRCRCPRVLCVQGDVTKLDVRQYMFIFLKFISSVIPTIEYDYTMQVSTAPPQYPHLPSHHAPPLTRPLPCC